MTDDEPRKLIKRSYPFLAYEILNDETNEFGNRYNATNIAIQKKESGPIGRRFMKASTC